MATTPDPRDNTTPATPMDPRPPMFGPNTAAPANVDQPVAPSLYEQARNAHRPHGPLIIPTQEGMAEPIVPITVQGVSYNNDRITSHDATPLVSADAAKHEQHLISSGILGTADDPMSAYHPRNIDHAEKHGLIPNRESEEERQYKMERARSATARMAPPMSAVEAMGRGAPLNPPSVDRHDAPSTETNPATGETETNPATETTETKTHTP